jgi:hypothetical protein
MIDTVDLFVPLVPLVPLVPPPPLHADRTRIIIAQAVSSVNHDPEFFMASSFLKELSADALCSSEQHQ